jgi:murein DD-endopeptidase MepM/ murein hydrolase activator NlpD
MTGDYLGKQASSLATGIQLAQQTGASLTQSQLDAVQAQKQAIQAQNAINAEQGQGANVFAGISSLMDTYSKQQQVAAQAAMERQKKLSEVEYAQASMLMNQIEANAQEIIYKKNRGAYEDQINQVVSAFPNLSPSQAQELYNRGYGVIKDTEKQQAAATLDGINKLNDAVASQKQSQLMARLVGTLARMESPTADTETLWKDFDKFVTDAIAGGKVDEVRAAQMISVVYEEALKSYRIGIGARAQIEEKLANLNKFLEESNTAYEKYGDNPQLYRQAIYAAATRNNVPFETGVELVDPLFNERALYEHQQLQSQIQNLEEEQIMTELDTQGLEDSQLRLLALGGFIDPARKAMLKGQLPPGQYAAVEEVIKLMENAEKARTNYNRDINNLKQQLTQFNAATAGIVAGKGQDGDIDKAASMLNRFIELNAQTNPALAERLQQQQQEAQIIMGFSPEERAKALQEQIEWRNQTAKLIEEEITLKAQELKQVEDALAPYGLNNVNFRDPALMEKVKVEYQGMRDRLAKEVEARRSQAQSNFNRGEPAQNLAKVKSTRVDKEITLPILAGDKSKVVIGHGFGAAGSPAHGRSRAHTGIDIASVGGAKLTILSVVPGKVIRVLTPEQSGGYGNMVDIKDANGMLHRYAHLDSVNIKVGQILKAGNKIGNMGSTGDSTGVHLHYEVREDLGDSSWGENGAKDPEIYLSTLGQQATSTQPRSDNADQYVNAPNPYTNNYTNDYSNVLPARALALNRTSYIIDDVFQIKHKDPIPLNQAFTSSNPIQPSSDPGTRSNNNGTSSNFGYKYLAKNPDKAAKIKQVAANLGINPQWLADIIAFESKFTTLGHHGNGAYGLIGFRPRGGGDRRVWLSDGTTVDQIANMSFNQQMDKVEQYIRSHGKIKSIQELAAVVFTGQPGLEAYRRNPAEALRTQGEGGFNLGDYIRALGRDVRRSYQVSDTRGTLEKTAPTHTTYTPGCEHCEALLASGSQIVAHRGMA